jgi:chromosome segregation ATPase
MSDESVSNEIQLDRIGRELKTIRELVSKLAFAVADAESEIPEKMRRFMNYMHDIHDIKYMYEELGHPVPKHHLRELERCDDRYRQLLTELHLDGGAFDKIRRKMADDPLNRWDHTKLLTKPEEDTP